MKNKKFDELWQIFSEAQTQEEQYAIMKEFMFNSSFDELIAWNDYLSNRGSKVWEEHRKTGLSKEDRAWYEAQFARFDDLEKQIKLGRAA